MSRPPAALTLDHEFRQPAPGGRRGRRATVARAALSVTLAAGAAFGVRQLFPDGFHAVTDIVGHPTHADFNINRYFHNYYLVAFLFPLAVVAFYGVIGWVVDGRGPGPATSMAEVQTGTSTAKVWSPGRVVAVGMVFGLELAVCLHATGAALAAVVLTATVGYLFAVVAAASAFRCRCSGINLVLANFTVLGLWAVSRSTVVELASGPVRHYPWFPFSLAATLTALGLALSRYHRKPTERAEARVLRWVVAPVALTVLVARLPGAIPVFDLFHDGEALVPIELLRHGLFPWRDFVFIHGAFDDIARSAVGERLFDRSLWGARAGQQLLLTPVYWLALWAFACRALRRHQLALVALAALVVVAGPEYSAPSLRFFLWPVVLLTLTLAIDRPSWSSCAVFITALAAQVLMTPESGFGMIACGVTIVFVDLRRETGPYLDRLRRTKRCAVSATAVAVVWFAWLGVQGAAGDFVRQTLQFAEGHRLTGGIPIAWGGLAFLAAATLPVAGICATIWYVASRLLARRRFTTDDWLLVAASVMVALYYPKFLARGDGHVYQPLATAFPLFLLLAARGLDWATTRLRRPAVGTAALAILVAAATVPTLLPSLSRLPERYRTRVGEDPRLAKIGYATAGAVNWELVDDMRKVIDRYLRPGEALFDFTNQPGLFHYLLGRRPSTRFYHATLAIRQRAQRDVIADLRRRPPRLVVYDNDRVGLYQWDGITNMVRHYEVSQYLLDHYRPAARLHGYILMVRPEAVAEFQALLPHGLSEAPSFDGVPYGAQTCDWGYAPSFLRRPDPDAPRVDVSFRRSDDGRVRIAVPQGLRLTDYRWLELVARSGWPRSDLHLTAGGTVNPSTRMIRFQSIATNTRALPVRVGSCPAWHAFDSAELEIAGADPHDIEAVRLIR